ncbi:AMP-binding protein, partial [Gammaproteobacteria bacterium]|nr:AMP-binding protein [Gammaproteobacteria bacterium]
TQVYLLDANRAPVPIGVAGELYIGGDGLARGYLNQPELTAEKFVSNHFSAEPGQKLYRTGDLGRYRSDGSIEFLGRIDDQIKLRGFRVELGEIETVLTSHPSVRTSTVLANEDSKGNKRLIAYIVADHQPAPATRDLRNYLKRKLPDYMVPSYFVSLDSLPLTANGKVDRNALPEFDRYQTEAEDRYTAPRNTEEAALAEIWADVLEVDKVGIHDNFFDLGGHSLLTIRLVFEVEKKLGKNVPVGMLFESPTIAQLAGALDKQVKPEFSSLIAIQPEGSKPPFFCVHGYNSYIHLARYLRQDRPLYGLAQHHEGRKIRHTRIEDIAAHYIEEIQCVQPRGPYFLGGHSIGGLIAFEMAQQLHRAGQGLAFLALFDPTPPGNVRPSGQGYSDVARAHYYNLMRVDFKGKAGYMVGTISAPLQSALKRAACSAYHYVGVSLPPKLQTFYVDEIVYKSLYAKMSQEYSPMPYPGVVDLFKAEDGVDTAGLWGALAEEGIKLHLNPGNHLSMIAEPGIATLAGELQDGLDRAQACIVSG